MKKIWIVGILLVFCTLTYAQKGTIRGTVYEESTGETVVGVTVLLKGTFTGTTTDLDGKFSLDVDPGTHDLQLSFISFQTLLIEGISIKPNEVKVLNDLILKESNLELMEVVIQAEALRTTEAAMMTIKRKSPVMFDGITASKIKLTGDATAVEAAKRVTGVSIEDGKYVFVRGLGDRYSKTTLNHVDIPGLDPDRNSLQMDIFPSNLIDNIVVSKNFTADMPADFTGGILNIETKDFPETRILSISAGISYNPQTNLTGDFLSYKGGDTDFLGIDDGTRALPARAREPNIPTPISGASDAEVVDFIKSFSPELAATPKTSFFDYNFGLTLGDQLKLKKNKEESNSGPTLGYIFSLSYKNDYTFYDDVTFGEYQRYIDPERYEMRYATIQNGQIGEHNVLVGALGGVALKTNLSKIRLTAMHLQNGESRAGKFQINNDGEAVGQSGYLAGSDVLEYNQRALTNLLLNGAHVLGNSGWDIDWRLSATLSKSDDPDIRKTAFTYRSFDTLFNAGAGGNPSRIWRSLSEINTTAKVDVSKKYKLSNKEARLKLGIAHNYKNRDYEILFFDIQFFSSQKWIKPDPANVLDAENLYPNKPNSIYYQSGNNDPNPNEYQSNVNNFAAYISNEFYLIPKLKSILGVRLENYLQRHTGRDQIYAGGDVLNGKNLDNEKVLESIDFFPSVNFIYELTPNQNLRAAFSRTIARPSFKELSFAQIIDPLSNRIFNGSLFTYPAWNGSLTETRIDNIDFRWEMFLERGQMYSFSAFYKQFDDPIELVRIPEQQTSTEYQPRNVGDGRLYGVELEVRRNLGFANYLLSNFEFNGNVTFVVSEIDMTSTEFNSRKTYQKAGETIQDKRVMAGQSPYVINAGITYANTVKGWEGGVFYNVKGPTLLIVGAGLFPDIYIKEFHSLNLSVIKRLGKSDRTVVDFKISNILAQRTESYYQSFRAEDQLYSSFNPGTSFSLGISHNF